MSVGSRGPPQSFAFGARGPVGPISNADNLREVFEVFIPRVQRKIVLQNKGRQPHVVGRNRGALFPELAENGCVVVRRLVVSEEHAHALFHEEPPEYALVLGLPAPVGKAGPKLAEHDERQRNCLCFLQERHRFDDSLTEIDVAIRVESNPQRQRLSSTRS